jgi:hypothetical protein
MKRRDLLVAAGTLGASFQGQASARPKAPYKVVFSNDLTNIATCTSPYHKKGQALSTEMIQATVDEVAGVDVHMLQPGLCWIPWWKSRVYPTAEHYAWVKEKTGRSPDEFGAYMLSGNDIVDVFVKRCRAKGQAPFVSFRLNDGHHLENVGTRESMAVFVTKFYADHPEYRIGTDRTSWDQRVHNWAIPEVRDHKFSFIREICEGYDIDGFELDFMRHTSHFRMNETTTRQRSQIMAEFVARVRKALDETAQGKRRRWLCARVPCFLSLHDRSGIDLPAMVEAGLDMVNASGYYFTIQQTDLPKIRKQVPKAAVYLEATHSIWNGPSLPGKYDSFSFMRTTEPQFATAANLVYSRGGDGMSLFNFVYYREHGTPGRGPFNEPPFDVLKRLGDRRWVASQPQWYLLCKSWGPQPLPKTFQKGQTHAFSVDLAPTVQRAEGILRLRTLKESSGCRWTVRVNGTALETRPYVAKPIEHPYDAALGQANEYACFRCPRKLVRKGINEIAVTMEDGDPASVEYLDLVLPN